ncbi:SsrA-binding protein SmpB [Candidatus Puniceispirillum sp.]|uniref:SsrA-binding protein SmpB n=1 Tax=Candidatus Puniceispirillum sp. TaxID=2026719 RepID=UPI003F69ACC1
MASGHISTGRIAENRKARHEYEIEDRIEAGLILLGSEVKSLRTGRASIAESYAGEDSGRLMLFNANIPIYEPARANHEPKRPRELLVKTRERNKLLGLIRREGMTLVPLSLYFNDKGVAKISVGLAKGRKKQDKRQAAKDRDWGRDKARLLRGKN